MGVAHDRIIAGKYLKIRKKYRVIDIVSGVEETHVRLKGFKNVWFNADMFGLVRHGTKEEIRKINRKKKEKRIKTKYSPFIQAWMESRQSRS